ncbi:MAG: alpha/beta fold hydrolase [Desulfocapsaceae bacterium]|nr:alpha/beta fold hydrolase [Desulfocapsaceae bacterium]
MNRSAYFTTGFAIKTFASLSKADVVIEGQENIPEGPKIFVVNHFTRVETLLIPYYIFKLTNVPALSLAAHILFQGRLKRYLELVGAVSTRDPNRDRIIIKGLLTGTENWIIFPEGRMVKSKKIIGDGSFLITHEEGRHKPHTGAASLALRAEFFRNHMLEHEKAEPENIAAFLDTFEIPSLDEIRGKTTSIVPVNLTYYPIRAKENIASQFATRIMKEVPERVLEELMTEGTMFFSGVDLDIHIGQPITLSEYMKTETMQSELQKPIGTEPSFSEKLSREMHSQAEDIMHRYMTAIYDMTTVNHDHLFASFLERYPYKKISAMGLRRRVYLAAKNIFEKNIVSCNIHRSLKEDQIHLLTDDRFKKAENFIQLALEKNVVNKENGKLVKHERNIPDLLQFHRERIDNPIDVMVNEIEPLKYIQKLVRSIAIQPDFFVKRKIVRLLLRDEHRNFIDECSRCEKSDLSSAGSCLLPGSTRKIGVVLVHSYLSIPEELLDLARWLNRQGLWVYLPRLPGHGTTPEDLAQTDYSAWQLSVERGYAIISSICKKVVLGGVSIGGCLAFDLAARLPELAGVFAVCPPLSLKNYSTSFMPSIDVWHRILAKIKRDALDVSYFQFESENPYINYDRNPVYSVKNVGSFLEQLRPMLKDIIHPSLILHADRDPVVDSNGSRIMYEELGSTRKEYMLFSSDRHILTSGVDSDMVNERIGSFIREVTQ